MFHVGLDVHVQHITVCILNPDGEFYRRCTVHSIGEVVLLLKELPGSCQACYGVGTDYGFGVRGTLADRQNMWRSVPKHQAEWLILWFGADARPIRQQEIDSATLLAKALRRLDNC